MKHPTGDSIVNKLEKHGMSSQDKKTLKECKKKLHKLTSGMCKCLM